MRYAYGMTLAAALIFGCSSTNQSTRPVSGENPTATAQPTSIEGTGSTAGTAAANTVAANSAPANTAPADPAATPVPSNPQTASTDTSAPATAATPSPSAPAYASAPSDTATNAPPATAGSTYGANTGTSGSVSAVPSADSFKTVTGSVAKIDQNSITLDQSAGGVTLTVDSNTQVLRRGQPIAAGIAAIHEGQQVRASFDPSSNRADKIEVMGRGKKHHKAMTNPSDSAPAPADNTAPTNPR